MATTANTVQAVLADIANIGRVRATVGAGAFAGWGRTRSALTGSDLTGAGLAAIATAGGSDLTLETRGGSGAAGGAGGVGVFSALSPRNRLKAC